MKSFTLDASVAAKWVLPGKNEPLADQALRILDGYGAGVISLAVPDLFWAEAGNILWKSVRVGRIPERAAQEGMEWLRDLAIPTLPTQPLIADAMTIAVRWGRTVSDSVYLALAVESGRPLLTADEKLANAVAAHFPVRWLGSVV